MSEPTLPQIFTYAADNPETPAHMRCAAALDQTGPGLHWVCFGPTREAARDKLAAYWLEKEAERPRKPPKRKADAEDEVSTPEVVESEPAADLTQGADAAEDVGDVL